MLLAIDTATQQAGIALTTRDAVLIELVWQAGRHHTEEMPPAINAAFTRTGTTPAELTGVAVTIGPGSFTGLRIGLSLAKGFAAAHDLLLVGIPTLDVIAAPHTYGITPLCAVLQAGRGRLASAFYAPDEEDVWQRRGKYRLGRIEGLADLLVEPTRIVGELQPSERDWLRETLGDRAVLTSPAANVRRPAVLAELAWNRIDAGDTDDVATLDPIYLHVAASNS